MGKEAKQSREGSNLANNQSLKKIKTTNEYKEKSKQSFQPKLSSVLYYHLNHISYILHNKKTFKKSNFLLTLKKNIVTMWYYTVNWVISFQKWFLNNYIEKLQFVLYHSFIMLSPCTVDISMA